MRPADGPSNGSATLSRIRFFADYTIAMLESSFRKRQGGSNPVHRIFVLLAIGKALAEAGIECLPSDTKGKGIGLRSPKAQSRIEELFSFVPIE
jgi:hypothetical protein